jgi:hypothetical protein
MFATTYYYQLLLNARAYQEIKAILVYLVSLLLCPIFHGHY